MDRFGLDLLLPFEHRVNTVAELGYAKRMVPAPRRVVFQRLVPGSDAATAAPDWYYTQISDDVLRALRARGVNEEQTTTMLVDNPRRYCRG